jgi:hypothetical protein
MKLTTIALAAALAMSASAAFAQAGEGDANYSGGGGGGGFGAGSYGVPAFSGGYGAYGAYDPYGQDYVSEPEVRSPRSIPAPRRRARLPTRIYPN